MSTAPLGGRTRGRVLVAAQFALIAWLAWRGVPSFVAGPAGWAGGAAWALLAAALAVGASALAANRPGNFNIHPEPRAGGVLVMRGPYRWVRHPMYSALLLGALAVALAASQADAWLAALAMLGVLNAKARLEERWMALMHPGYDAYRARTGRFLPGL